MYIVNGIAYAGEFIPEIEVTRVTAFDGMMMLLTFSTGEKRLYDASALLKYPAFKPLEDANAFKAVSVDHGVVTWLDGELDIAPETLYQQSTAYPDTIAG